MLEIGAALLYYKLVETLLQIGAASLLQIGASVVTNWRNYYKSMQPLKTGKLWQIGANFLQIGAGITN